MALRDVAYRRLCPSLRETLGEDVAVTRGSKLGEPPIGLEALVLEGQFLDAINSDAVGFRDFTKGAIPKKAVTESTTLGELADSIVALSRFKNVVAYEGAMQARMRLGLREAIAELAGVLEEQVVPGAELSEFNLDSAAGRERLRKWFANSGCRKYLLSAPTDGDLRGTVSRVEGRLVGLCIA